MEFTIFLIRLGVSAAIVLGIRAIWMRHANRTLTPIAKRIKGYEKLFIEDGRSGPTKFDQKELLADVSEGIVELNQLFDRGNSYSDILIKARKSAEGRHPMGFIKSEVEIMASTVLAAAYDRGTGEQTESRLKQYRTGFVWFSLMFAMERIVNGFISFDGFRTLWLIWKDILGF